MKFDEFVLQMKIFEGYRASVYKDFGGVATIGFGFTDETSIKLGYMDIETATNILIDKLKSTSEKVKNVAAKYSYNFNDNQLLALTSFTYNCGIGNLEKLFQYGKRNVQEIGNSITLYNKCAGTVLKGLVKRREWEQNLYFTKDDSYSLLKSNNVTGKDIQILCNTIIKSKNLSIQTLTEDGIIGKKSEEVIFILLSKLL